MRDDEDRRRVIAGHLIIMANKIKEENYKLSERQRNMLVTLIQEINLEYPEPREDNELER